VFVGGRLGVHPKDFIPIQYKTEMNIFSELLGIAPLLLILGSFFFLRRFSSGMMGGGLPGSKGGKGSGIFGLFFIVHLYLVFFF